jgi:hypothetical protein
MSDTVKVRLTLALCLFTITGLALVYADAVGAW